MLTGFEFIVAAGAVALGLALFMVGLRRRPLVGSPAGAETSAMAILQTNVFALGIIGLMFFGIAFLVDVMM